MDVWTRCKMREFIQGSKQALGSFGPLGQVVRGFCPAIVSFLACHQLPSRPRRTQGNYSAKPLRAGSLPLRLDRDTCGREVICDWLLLRSYLISSVSVRKRLDSTLTPEA